MPHISAFRGLRYDLGHVGSLEGVVAPPYDSISAQLQNELYQQHPANVIRLILNREEPGDTENAKYDRSGRFFKNWQREGVLQREPDPAIYVYHQVFDYEGSTFTRRGFTCLAKLDQLVAIEESDRLEMKERMQLMQSCPANLNPILGLYTDQSTATQQILESAVAGVAPIEATDRRGVSHRLWPVTSIQVINDVTTAMTTNPAFVVAGHQSLEAARAYREELGGVDLDAAHLANFVMLTFVEIDDGGLVAQPCHRLVRGIPSTNSENLMQLLAPCFDLRVAGEGTGSAKAIWDQLENEEDQETVALFCRADDRWLIAKINEAGCERISRHSGGRDERPLLGVSIVDHLICTDLLGWPQTIERDYAHCITEVIEAIDQASDDRASRGIELAALTLPPTLEHLRTAAEHGRRLPNDSVHLYPHLLSGLIFNSHDNLLKS